MHRTKGQPIAAFDIDGTLVREQLLVLLLKECFEFGVFPKVAELAFREMRRAHRDRKLSYDVYERKLIDLFEERIRGKIRADVEVVADIVAQKNRDWLYVFTRTLLDQLKRTHRCVAITGAFEETVRLLAPEWGFERYYPTVLEIDAEGRYTGVTLKLPVAAKGEVLAAAMKDLNCEREGSVAIGDTGSDIALLEAVDHPIAFNPNNTLASEAERRGWPMVVERKDCIYVFAGGSFRRFTREHATDAVRYVLQRQSS